MTDITPDKLRMAREWANGALNDDPFPPREGVAARVIQSLPDEWVDAARLREVIAGHWAEGERDLLKDHLQALLPAPTPRTMADMTPEEREACQWMQAISDPDSGYTDGTVVIVQVQDDRAVLMWGDGSFDTRYHQHITPLPDLPRLEWPASVPPTEDTPELEQYQEFVDTFLTPEPAPTPDRDGKWWPTAASIGNVTINPAGEIVLHSGNFRDMQLHLTPGKADDLADILKAAAQAAREALEGRVGL